jgi:hypothetical protein
MITASVTKNTFSDASKHKLRRQRTHRYTPVLSTVLLLVHGPGALISHDRTSITMSNVLVRSVMVTSMKQSWPVWPLQKSTHPKNTKYSNRPFDITCAGRVKVNELDAWGLCLMFGTLCLRVGADWLLVLGVWYLLVGLSANCLMSDATQVLHLGPSIGFCLWELVFVV